MVKTLMAGILAVTLIIFAATGAFAQLRYVDIGTSNETISNQTADFSGLDVQTPAGAYCPIAARESTRTAAIQQVTVDPCDPCKVQKPRKLTGCDRVYAPITQTTTIDPCDPCKVQKQRVSGNAILDVYSSGPNIVSPHAFSVHTGDQVGLEVRNHTAQNVRFDVPSMDVSVEVPATSYVVVPLNFSRPADDEIFWRLSLNNGGRNNIEGRFLVCDFANQCPIATTTVDTTELNSIINYDTTFDYEDKPEPMYNQPTQVETERSDFIRGYW